VFGSREAITIGVGSGGILGKGAAPGADSSSGAG